MFSIYAEIDSDDGIYKNGVKPWAFKEIDLFFKKLTTNSVVIIGKKAWNNLYKRPVPNCVNIVISDAYNLLDYEKPDLLMDSVDSCIDYLSDNFKNMHKFVIGGRSIYEQFLTKKVIHEIYIVHIKQNYMCDRSLKLNIAASNPFIKTNNPMISINKYYALNIEETNIINTINYIIEHGNQSESTVEIFCKEFRFDLSAGHIPLTTLVSLNFKNIFANLIIMLKSQQNQLETIINTILLDKFNKNIKLVIYHYIYHFYVNDNKISCKITQDASNIFEWSNSCVYGALLLIMICSITYMAPAELIWAPDILYVDICQIPHIKTNKIRKPFPLLKIINRPNTILDFTYDCFKLINYSPHIE